MSFQPASDKYGLSNITLAKSYLIYGEHDNQRLSGWSRVVMQLYKLCGANLRSMPEL